MNGLLVSSRSSSRFAKVAGAAGLCVALLTASPVMAQTGPGVASFFSQIEFSGLVDTYYTYNFNEPTTGTPTPLRSFDISHNQFQLSFLEFAAGKAATEDSRVGFRFDLQYGSGARVFNFDPNSDASVYAQQAYISYLAPVGSGLTLDFGKFVTPIGTEPTEANLNYNYSRTFLYQLGPFYHFGMRVGYNVNDKFALAGLLVNGWNAEADTNAGKSFMIGATIKPTPQVTIIQNFLVGPEQADNTDDVRKLSDTNLAYTINDKMAAGFNYAYNWDSIGGDGISWNGAAFYFRSQITPIFAIAPRFGFYNDSDGFITGAEQSLKEFTLTGELKSKEGLLFRMEYRRDWSDIPFFDKAGELVDDQNTFTFAWIYAFASKP